MCAVDRLVLTDTARGQTTSAPCCGRKEPTCYASNNAVHSCRWIIRTVMWYLMVESLECGGTMGNRLHGHVGMHAISGMRCTARVPVACVRGHCDVDATVRSRVY